jgi:hypothetical protein
MSETANYTDPFNTIIDEAVRSAEADKKLGSYAVDLNFAIDVEKVIAVGGDDLSYMRMYPTERNRRGLEFRGLDFEPTHAFEIMQMNRIHGRVARQTIFGVDPEGRVVRAMTQGSGITAMFGEYLRRQLDDEESAGLLGFMRAPHLDDGANRALALRVTPEEQEKLEELKLEERKRNEDFVRRQQEITDMMRKGFSALQHLAERLPKAH